MNCLSRLAQHRWEVTLQVNLPGALRSWHPDLPRSPQVALVPEEPAAPRLGHIDGIANWLAPRTLALSRLG